MRCLYCGKELALLKRLRGGGDFCSDAHKQSYQEEYNRLALSRFAPSSKESARPPKPPAQNAPPPCRGLRGGAGAGAGFSEEAPRRTGGSQ